MRVLTVEIGGWGGIAHYAYNLLSALGKTGCECGLLTGQPYELAGFPRSFALFADLDPHRGYTSNIEQVLRSTRRYRPDILHVQSTLSARRDAILLPLFRAWAGVPVVLTAHNVTPHDAEGQAPGMRLAYRGLYRGVTHVITHTRASRHDLINQFGLSPARVSCIPHGNYSFVAGDCPDRASACAAIGLDPSRPIVLFFGTLRPYKGLDDLFAAIPDVLSAIPDVQFCIAGKSKDLDIEALRVRLPKPVAEESVTIRDEYIAIEDIQTYFGAADLAVFPYRAITQSGALQLAFAAGVPVVATRTGGLPESVVEGTSGMLVEPGDSQELGRALVRILRMTPDTRKRMGAAGKARAEGDYSWERIAGLTQRLYDAIPGVGGARP